LISIHGHRGLAGLGVVAGGIGADEPAALASWMTEISDPALQRTVLRLPLTAARADDRLADGESMVVDAARHHGQRVDGLGSGAMTSTRRHAA